MNRTKPEDSMSAVREFLDARPGESQVPQINSDRREKQQKQQSLIPLKPCPYCGSTEHDRLLIGGDQYPVLAVESFPNGSGSYWVVCCGICHGQGPEGQTATAAAEKYNTRPTEVTR